MARALTYGEASGARDFLAVAPLDNSLQSLLLRHGFAPTTPAYVFQVPAEVAVRLGQTLAGLLPGHDVTSELLNRRGQADLDRIDRLARGIMRSADHVYWLGTRKLQAAFVRQGNRIAAYAYGGANSVGPVAGATQDAALCALGWALKLAARQLPGQSLHVRVPAPFSPAVDALQDSGARLHATLMIYHRGGCSAFDRYILGSLSLP